MKILSIHLLNLNSLKGKFFRLDFQTPPLQACNLFAITGETGAGKTTILDAITLALYGKVARKSDVKEIIAYGTAEAAAEVVFQISAQVYLAKWHIARAHKKIDGNLQSPRRELARRSDAGDWETLTSDKRLIDKKIQEITQLSYPQFTKSVLLAQGDFAAFLNAEKSARGQLLERITGTEIYADISKFSFEKAKKHKELYLDSEKKRSFIELLSAAQIAAYNTENKALTEKIQTEEKKVAALKKAEHWYAQKNILSKKQQQDKLRFETLKIQFEQLASRFATLETHFKTLPFQKKIAQLKNLQQTTTRLSAEHKTLLASVKAQTEARTLQTNTKSETAQQYDTAKLQLESERAELENVMRADRQIAEITQRLETEKTHYLARKQELKQVKTDCTEVEKKQDIFKNKIAEIEIWIEKNKALKVFSPRFSLLKEKIKQEKKGDGQISALEKSKLALSENQKKSLALVKKTDEALSSAAKTLEKQKAELNAKEAILEKLKGGQEEKAILAEKTAVEKKCRQAETALFFCENWHLTQKKIKDAEAAEQQSDLQNKEAAARKKTLSGYIERQEEVNALLEKNYQLETAVVNYEAARAALKPGEPCPLCGSEQHVFRTKGVPDVRPDDTQKKWAEGRKKLAQWMNEKAAAEAKSSMYLAQTSAAKKQRLNLTQEAQTQYEKLVALVGEEWETKNLTQEAASITKKLAEITKKSSDIYEIKEKITGLNKEIQNKKLEIHNLHAHLAQEKQQIAFRNNELEALKEQSAEAKAELGEIKKNISEILAGLHQLPHISDDRTALVRTIETQLGILDKKSAEKQALEALINDLKVTHSALKKEIAEKTVFIGNEHRRISDDYAQKEALKEKRDTLFGQRQGTPQEILRRLEDTLEQKRRNAAKADLQLTKIKTLLQNHQSALEVCKENLALYQKQSALLENELLPAVRRSGFDDLQAVYAAELPAEKAEEIRLQKQEMVQAQARAAQACEDSEKALEALKKDKPDFGNAEEVAEALAEAEDALKIVQRQKIVLEKTLQDDEEKQKHFAEEKKKSDKLKQSYARWEELNELIGSANGDKFRIFAQTLTLAHLVKRANYYLSKIYPRYLIEVKKDDKLGLQILDTYQADHLRSMETLSGGESFLVSLGLALGLSDMAGKRASIKTLFIDEGFGTLDPATLDVVITSLENLQFTGKTIGIISHVEALKERIRTQVLVKKQRQGVSTIELLG